MGVLDGFVKGKKKFLLEIAKLVHIKARDSYLRIWKKFDPVVNIEVRKGIALSIARGEEEKSPNHWEEGSPVEMQG